MEASSRDANQDLVNPTQVATPVDPVATPVDPVAQEPMEQQAQINLFSNKHGAMVETRFPTGEIDEKNMLHVLAWWIAEEFGRLLPTAITAWHKRRTEMAQAGGAKPGDAAPEPALVAPALTLVGENGRPIGA